jgi:zinc protease
VEDRRLPLVAYSLQVRAAKPETPMALSGLATFAAALLREGAGQRSSQEIARLVDHAGGSLSASAGDDFTSVTATFMKQHERLALDLLAEVVRQPTFPPEEWERVAEQHHSALAVQYQDAEYLLPAAWTRLLFGDHPYAQPADGTPDSLAAITRDGIAAFHQRHYTPAHAWLAIAGDVDPEEAIESARRAFGGWEAPPPDDPALPAPPASAPRVLLLDDPGAHQSQIAIGHLSVPRPHPDYLALQVANQVFGGSFNSRLNLKLRAEEGLTYGAGSSFRCSRLAGLFRASTFTRTARTADAVGLIAGLIRDWKANPATADELAEAKAYMSGSFSLELETCSAVAARVLAQTAFGLPEDFYASFRERVERLTIEDIRAAVERHIDPDRLTIAVAGDAASLRTALEEFGPARVTPMEGLDLLAPDWAG